jgi:glycosyltransferase involved in cell wall biosynthesis
LSFNQIYNEIQAISLDVDKDLTIIINSSLDLSHAQKILDIPGVKFLIISDNDVSQKKIPNGRIFYRDHNNRSWMPKKLTDFVVCIGPMGALGLRFSFDLWSCGVRHVKHVFLKPPHPQINLGLIIYRALINAIIFRLDITISKFARTNKFISYLEKKINDKKDVKLSHYLNEIDLRPNVLQFEQYVDKKIVIVGASLGPGGAERQMALTIIGLKNLGYLDITFLHLFPLHPPNNFYLKKLVDNHVNYKKINEIPLDLCYGQRYQFLSKLESFEGLAYSVLPYFNEFIESRPQVVHVWQDQTSIYAALGALVAGVPKIIISWRSLAPDNFSFNRKYMRVIYQFLSAHKNIKFLNNSIHGANDYKRWLSRPGLNIEVIYNGFDFSNLHLDDLRVLARDQIRQKLKLNPNTLLVGGVMRFTSEKQPLLFVAIAKEISKRIPDIHFLMVGDGPLMTKVREQAINNIPNRFSFVGNVGNVYEYISAMDLLMLTSRVEGLPNVLIEAQALGKPVIATDVGGCSEAIVEGDSGYLFHSLEPEVAATQVSTILLDTKFREKAAVLGPRFISSRFSFKRMIFNTLKAYEF